MGVTKRKSNPEAPEEFLSQVLGVKWELIIPDLAVGKASLAKEIP